jgi:hypothetical protein
MKELENPRGKLGRRRTRIEDGAKFAFDRRKPRGEFLDGVDEKKILGAFGGRASKPLSHQAPIKDEGRGTRHGPSSTSDSVCLAESSIS